MRGTCYMYVYFYYQLCLVNMLLWLDWNFLWPCSVAVHVTVPFPELNASCMLLQCIDNPFFHQSKYSYLVLIFSDKMSFFQIFNSRQLALKLIANVTYGYTAAGFSGRMPCAELADSIVQCGRITLETAISFVNNHDKWKARVVYGDTDRSSIHSSEIISIILLLKSLKF